MNHTDEFDGRVWALAEACEAGTTESIADASAALVRASDVGRAAYENGFDWSTSGTDSQINQHA